MLVSQTNLKITYPQTPPFWYPSHGLVLMAMAILRDQARTKKRQLENALLLIQGNPSERELEVWGKRQAITTLTTHTHTHKHARINSFKNKRSLIRSKNDLGAITWNTLSNQPAVMIPPRHAPHAPHAHLHGRVHGPGLSFDASLEAVLDP